MSEKSYRRLNKLISDLEKCDQDFVNRKIKISFSKLYNTLNKAQELKKDNIEILLIELEEYAKYKNSKNLLWRIILKLKYMSKDTINRLKENKKSD